METLGKLAVSLATNSGLPAKQRTVTEVVPITAARNLPATYCAETERVIPDRVVMFWEGGSADGRGSPVLRRALSGEETRALERRASDLRAAVAPYPRPFRREIGAAITGMLSGFPAMQKHDDETGAALAAGYLELLGDRPAWAIVQACVMVRQGRAGLNRSYCPSEAEFNVLVDRCVEVYARRLAAAEQLLTAKIAPPVPPKPTREEIEAKLGRSLPGAAQHLAQPERHDGNHAARVAADLAARKRGNNPEA